MKREVFICFIDNEKAFHYVKYEKLIELLLITGIDEDDFNIIKDLYWNQEDELILSGRNGNVDFNVRHGVRQGYILSSMLFNLYVEQVFR